MDSILSPTYRQNRDPRRGSGGVPVLVCEGLCTSIDQLPAFQQPGLEALALRLTLAEHKLVLLSDLPTPQLTVACIYRASFPLPDDFTTFLDRFQIALQSTQRSTKPL